MLEIFVLFKLGQAINRKATAKGWPGWPFVAMLVFLYVGGAFAGIVAGLIVGGGLNAEGDGDLVEFLIGYAAGALLGALVSYLVVLALPDRGDPDGDSPDRDGDYGDDGDDDGDRPRRIAKARRADGDDDEWRRR